MKKLFVVAAAVAAVSAQAVGIDVSSTVTTISDQLSPIALIGAAVLGITVAIKAYHWIRRALA